MNFETYTAAVASTAHLTAAEAALLNEDLDGNCPLACMGYSTYGWAFYVDSFEDNLEYSGLAWTGLRAILTACKEQCPRARWLVLDCDAEPVEGVPTYDW